ncbi:MAG: PD40 domain-containing protein [Chloroflexi bacterium]|nr:PD40 domain-containing protein [Chloroflexota bacterium]
MPLNWSPDGTQLLFKRLSELWLYNVTTNEQQYLLDNVRTATWSPDGQRIAYVPRWNQALGREDRRVLVLDLATKQSVEVGDTQARGPIISHLVWTPERGILLATPHEILAYPDTARTAPTITVFAVPPTVQTSEDTRIALAPDGRHALIVSGAPHPRLISFVADGTLIKTIEVDYPTSPLWSPDGQRVVFEHAGEFLSIYSAQGELLATSTPETLKLRLLDWSPDGAYLVYSTNGGGTGPFQAYLVQPGGSESIELVPPFTSTDGISAALWSPNHRHIAYTVGDYAAVGQEPARTTTYLMIATRANS